MDARRCVEVARSGLVALVLVGCVATEAPPPPRGVVVSGPPPGYVAEGAPPAAPNANAAWVAGYWHWTGLQYAWIPGHWENPPTGARWQAPRYSNANGAYLYEAGAWTQASSPSPPPPSTHALR